MTKKLIQWWKCTRCTDYCVRYGEKPEKVCRTHGWDEVARWSKAHVVIRKAFFIKIKGKLKFSGDLVSIDEKVIY